MHFLELTDNKAILEIKNKVYYQILEQLENQIPTISNHYSKLYKIDTDLVFTFFIHIIKILEVF